MATFGLTDLSPAESAEVLRAAGILPLKAGDPDANKGEVDFAGLSSIDASGSSCFETIHWDSDRQYLYMKFRKGKITYTWGQFPRGKWTAFKAAGSKGKFYHAHIAGRYQTNYRGP